ncbi:MAG: PIN domain-containing protein [Candidatus Aenigmarchaeota archaeon]|nr:PIN domain-containing protein [Candidatus Aenigmarchaeota archaeon]
MKPKTKKKLINRELLKPKHHIDTCIIIESAKNTKTGMICQKYFNLVGYKYRGYFSLPVIGEFFIKILDEIKEQYDRETALILLYDLKEEKSINFFVPSNKSKIGKITEEILSLDRRLEFTDASIVACAIEDKTILVTLDKDLLHNKKIEEQYNIKIRHPKELI